MSLEKKQKQEGEEEYDFDIANWNKFVSEWARMFVWAHVANQCSSLALPLNPYRHTTHLFF